MFQSIPGLEPFLLTVALIIGPWVVAEVRRLRQQARQAQNSNVAQPTPSRRRWLVMALVAAHSTYIFYKLFLHPPLNIFTALRAPLTTPSATLRNMLLTRAEPPSDALPAPLEELLVRLSSFDVRTLYIRLGHDAIQGCEHCTTADEYHIVALPAPLLEYVREALVAGALTSRALHKRHWRPWAVGLLVLAALFERYILASVHIKMPSTGMGVTMWHDRLWYFRQALFFFVPIALYVLPTKHRPPSAMSNLEGTKHSLDRIISNLQMLEMYRAATLRTPELRDQLADYWQKEQLEGELVRSDEEVQREADKVEMGIGPDGKLRQTAQLVAENLITKLTAPQ